jgi:hypothetical protein
LNKSEIAVSVLDTNMGKVQVSVTITITIHLSALFELPQAPFGIP